MGLNNKKSYKNYKPNICLIILIDFFPSLEIFFRSKLLLFDRRKILFLTQQLDLRTSFHCQSKAALSFQHPSCAHTLVSRT